MSLTPNTQEAGEAMNASAVWGAGRWGRVGRVSVLHSHREVQTPRFSDSVRAGCFLVYLWGSENNYLLKNKTRKLIIKNINKINTAKKKRNL